jgi:hypothetical protein
VRTDERTDALCAGVRGCALAGDRGAVSSVCRVDSLARALEEGSGDADSGDRFDVDWDTDAIDDIQRGQQRCRPADRDSDSVADNLDADSDNNLIPNAEEGSSDSDSDGVADYVHRNSASMTTREATAIQTRTASPTVSTHIPTTMQSVTRLKATAVAPPPHVVSLRLGLFDFDRLKIEGGVGSQVAQMAAKGGGQW